MLEFDVKDEKPTEFSVKNSVHAMSVLSKSLYSDPIEAIIRELSCNAIDSHIANGNPEDKFDITVDYSNENSKYYFKVRDYGTGLAPADLEKIYTTYFESTKDASDEFIGSFGLGSKSPFAYTDTFFVGTYYYGTLTTYQAQKSFEGLTLEKINIEFTQERNGLAVYFDLIEGKDYNIFINKMRKVLPFMEGKYNSDRIPDLRYLIKGNNYFVLLNWENLLNNYVVQNNVVYRLDNSKIDQNLKTNLPKAGVYFVVPPKSVSIAPSREELHYDNNTVQELNSTISSAIEEVNSLINNTINSKSVFELRTDGQNLRDMLGPWALEEYSKEEEYNGQLRAYKIRGFNSNYTVNYHILKKQWKYKKLDLNSINNVTYTSLLHYPIIYNDCPDDKLGLRRAKYYFNKYNPEHIKYLEDDKEYEQFCLRLALPQDFIDNKIIRTSTIKIERKKKGSVTKLAENVFTKYYGNSVISVNDPGEVNHYFHTIYNNPILLNKIIDKEDRSAFIDFLKNLDIEAYGISKKDAEDLEEDWILVDDVIIDRYKELYYELQGSIILDSFNHVKDFDFLKDLEGEQVVNYILKLYETIDNEAIKKKYNLFQRFKYYLPKESIISLELKHIDLSETLYAAYPMLEFVPRQDLGYLNNNETISNYVKERINANQSRNECSKPANPNAAECVD